MCFCDAAKWYHDTYQQYAIADDSTFVVLCGLIFFFSILTLLEMVIRALNYKPELDVSDELGLELSSHDLQLSNWNLLMGN
jgi:hypothetical protein